MKKISTVLVLLAVTAIAAVAQEYKAFRVGLGTGYASPSGKGAKGGVLFYLEPGYRVNDQILVNLRMEFAAMASGMAGFDGADVDVSTSGSYTLNGQYYFNNNNFRPFAGLGFGLYSVKAASVSFGAGNDLSFGEDGSKFGFYPRVGFDVGHFQLSIDYNIVSAMKQDFSYEDPDSGFTFNGEIEQKTSYLGIRIGAFIGGGRN